MSRRCALNSESLKPPESGNPGFGENIERLMSLRTRLICILLTVLALFMTLDFLKDRLVVFPHFIRLEHDEARKDMDRAVQSIRRELYHLDSLCHDWSAWDDTCRFIQGDFPEYTANNLIFSTFADARVNLICIADAKGEIIWGQAYDLSTKSGIPLPEFRNTYLAKDSPLITWDTTLKPLADLSANGILNLRQGPMLVASRPVLTSDNKGPIRGSLIMGRFLTEDMARLLSEQIQVNFHIFSMTSPLTPEPVRRIAGKLTPDQPYWFKENRISHLEIYTAFPDIKGETAFLVGVRFPRKISAIGYDALQYAFVCVLGAGFFVAFLVLILAKRLIIRPLTHLTAHAVIVGNTGDLSVRLNMNRNDEIGILAREFDRMLETLAARSEELAEANRKLSLDISERNQAEEKLRASEARYRSFVENFHGIIFEADRNFTPVFLHGAVKEITGYTEEEFVSGRMRLENIIHSEDLPRLLDEQQRILSSPGCVIRSEYRIMHKDGHVLSIRHLIRNICDDSGRPVLIQGIIHDITDRIKVEEAVCRNEKYYRLLLHSLGDEILVVDARSRITDMNRDVLSASGDRRQDVIGQYCFDVLPGFDMLLDRNDERSALERVFRTGKPYCSRHEYEAGDNSPVWKDIFMTPLSDEQGRITRVVMTLRDVTREVQLERQLRQSQKMEAIGTLAGGIAHDFNNILMTIMMNTEFVLKKTGTDAMIQECLDLSLQAAARARDLVDQILTFSRKSEQRKRSLKISVIVKESLKMLRSSLPATVDICWNIQAESDMILGDPAQIQQMVVNLCSNAAAAMNNSGTLSVELCRATLANHSDPSYADIRPGEYLRFTVQDTGHGIAPEIMDRIFDPFFTTRKPGEGSGMGLAVVMGIVEGLGGAIRVKSEPGKGAAFHVFIPVLDEKTLPAPDMEYCPVWGTGSLLVVDDEALILNILQKSLRDMGYEVTSCTSGAEALEIFTASPMSIDLVITDQTMLKMTGLELTARLKEIRPDIPVILCTGFDNEDLTEKAEDAGIVRILVKPVSASGLSRMISDILSPARENST